MAGLDGNVSYAVTLTKPW